MILFSFKMHSAILVVPFYFLFSYKKKHLYEIDVLRDSLALRKKRNETQKLFNSLKVHCIGI